MDSHILSMMSRGIYLPNSVDIVGDDGMLRYGRVVDVAEDGLMIDFLCPGQRQEFVPFGNIYLPTARQPLEMPESDTFPSARIAVELLVRESPSGPWMWIPAEMTTLVSHKVPGTYGMAIVHWFHEMERHDLVPVERIRWRIPGPGGWWGDVGRPVPPQFVACLADDSVQHVEDAALTLPVTVAKWTFSKCSVAIPSGSECYVVRDHLSSFNEELLRRKEPLCGVGIADGRLWLIERRSVADRIVLPSDVKDRSPRLQGIINDALSSLRFLSQWMQNNSPVDGNPKPDAAVLPTKVWREVFSYLTTRDQNRLRTVCAAWHGIVDSPILTANLVLTTDDMHPPGDSGHDLVHRMMSTVFHCLGPSTKHIILAGRLRDDCFFKVVDVISYVAKRLPGIQLSAIYAVEHEWHFCFGRVWGGCSLHHPDPLYRQIEHPLCRRHGWAPNGINEFILACRALPCSNIRLVRCAVRFTMDLDYFDDIFVPPSCNATVLTTRVMLGEDFPSELWNALDGCLPVPDTQEMDQLSDALKDAKLSEWVTRVTDDRSDKISVDTLCEVLCATQTGDPRPSSNFRGKKWCVDGLEGVQFAQLSRIALHFLIQLVL